MTVGHTVSKTGIQTDNIVLGYCNSWEITLAIVMALEVIQIMCAGERQKHV